MEDKWWNDEAQGIQVLADSGFFQTIKAVYRPHGAQTNPVLFQDSTTVLTERSEIPERWKERFNQPLN